MSTTDDDADKLSPMVTDLDAEPQPVEIKLDAAAVDIVEKPLPNKGQSALIAVPTGVQPLGSISIIQPVARTPTRFGVQITLPLSVQAFPHKVEVSTKQGLTDIIRRGENDIRGIREIFSPSSAIVLYGKKSVQWFVHSATVRAYLWTIIPLIIVGVAQLNVHINYNTFFGFDMPQHFNNLYDIVSTGNLTPPPEHPQEYYGYSEVVQAPAFYFLTAWISIIGKNFTNDGYLSAVPVALLAVTLLDLAVLCYFVQKMLRRASPLLRALCVCVLALLPSNVMTGTMYNNDYAMAVPSTLALITLLMMSRSGRFADKKLWLRAAIFTGFAITFKSTAVTVAVIYGGWAGYVALGYILKRNWTKAIVVAKASAIGIPLIVAPMAINLYHAGRYTTQPLGMGAGQLGHDYGWGLSLPQFLTTFDRQVFEIPVTLPQVGQTSLWSRLYITLFSDPYGLWHSRTDDVNSFSLDRVNRAIAVVAWAVPVALIMAVGFGVALFKTVIKRRQAMHDGAAVIVIATLVTVVSLLALLDRYWSQLVLQSRYILFLYPLLFLYSVSWLWKLFHKRYSLIIPMAKLLLWASLVVFCVSAIRFLWLTP